MSIDGIVSGTTGAAARRAALFRETPTEWLRRCTLGTAWALRPARIAGLPALGRLTLQDLIAPRRDLPHAHEALARPPGLCGIAHDLSVPVLIEAYRRGLYPFAHVGPPKWWSPPERCILDFRSFHMPKRLRGRLRQNRHRVTFDRDFDGVMKACSAPRPGKWSLTWITPRIMRAFADLHDAGHAHSFEVWSESGSLVGGGYGVAAGGCFTIESQFTRESHCSKIGFAVLNWHLAHWGFALADNKGPTQNTLEAGFRLVTRGDFQARLTEALHVPVKSAAWQMEADLPTVAAWQPADAKPCPVPVERPALRAKIRGALLLPAIDVVGPGGLAETFAAVV
jgi:leucyl/phenylalanyl-tRNA--protein transferase